jgi:hypothetical protein
MITILQMLRRPTDGMVNNVSFKVSKSDGEHAAEYFGAVMLPPSDGPAFVPFESLTQSTVASWVEKQIANELDIIDDLLEKQIDDKKHPVVVAGLPW